MLVAEPLDAVKHVQLVQRPVKKTGPYMLILLNTSGVHCTIGGKYLIKKEFIENGPTAITVIWKYIIQQKVRR